MNFTKICFGGPALEEPAVLLVLATPFTLLVWRTVRRPCQPPWVSARRAR
jgi:hypothetical protein